MAQKVNLVGFDQDFKKETELNKLENIRVTHSRGSIAFSDIGHGQHVCQALPLRGTGREHRPPAPEVSSSCCSVEGCPEMPLRVRGHTQCPSQQHPPSHFRLWLWHESEL